MINAVTLETKLKALGLDLPNLSKPGGNYVPVNIRGNIAYVAIQLPKFNDEMLYRGILGKDLTTEDGYKAMQLCALNVLAHIDHKIGLDNIAGLNHMDAYYRADADFNDAPKVVDGASDLFVRVLGEKGLHSRAIFGVEKLPRDFCAGITCSWTI